MNTLKSRGFEGWNNFESEAGFEQDSNSTTSASARNMSKRVSNKNAPCDHIQMVYKVISMWNTVTINVNLHIALHITT